MTYNASRLLQSIEDRLRQNPQESLQLLVRELGVGRHTIERVVRATTGKSFRDYQSGIVLSKALQLLNGSDALQIKQVAFSLGYCSTKSFSRYFKAQTGMTPSEFIADPLEKPNREPSA
jgi:AraC-like DNA-binding protein